MSKEALAKVIQRAISDGAFRRQLSSDPGTALRGFDLTADESAAIRSGDSGRLSSLGVDLRMSKVFTLGSDQATGDAAHQVLSSDLGAGYTGANTIVGQGSAGSGATTTVDPGTAGSSANTIGGQGSAGSSALTSGDQADHEAVIAGGTNSDRDMTVIPGEPAHALGSLTSGDNSGTFGNVLTPGDISQDGILVIDDQGPSGAVTPGEASDGPNISE
jgi:hypothetical protein